MCTARGLTTTPTRTGDPPGWSGSTRSSGTFGGGFGSSRFGPGAVHHSRSPLPALGAISLARSLVGDWAGCSGACARLFGEIRCRHGMSTVVGCACREPRRRGGSLVAGGGVGCSEGGPCRLLQAAVGVELVLRSEGRLLCMLAGNHLVCVPLQTAPPAARSPRLASLPPAQHDDGRTGGSTESVSWRPTRPRQARG